ncbi:WD40/YVTN/BNR-like repeat-containing protein [Rugosimonospora africana]|uniref:Exo-alpha-sialidase n=1 Tax=Rugosimonospora africana TaxID=556532 RepID=A0A8J3QV03_9ACTN|nr:sialidase family protein [Rugosimonospora africana]GIH16268.1 hypothetical protein Raf01_44400 [Rugosimonospora africana]
MRIEERVRSTNEPVPVHGPPARRRSRLLASLALAVLAATVTAQVTACSGSGGSPGSPSSPGQAGPSASATGSLAAGTETGAAGSSAAAKPPGGPVPHGFVAQDFTFASADQGWLLGTAPCSTKPCTSIVRTTDGGRTWVGIPAPKAELEPNGQNGCDANQLCVRALRFALSTTGYAYGSTALYLTRDGGLTWTKQSGQADAVELANGTALRVSHDTQGCPPGCGYEVSTAPVGSANWQAVTAPGTLTGNAVQLLRAGHHAYLAVYRNPAGGAENAQATLATSTDDGRHWTTRGDPCGTDAGKEGDTTQLAVGPEGSLTVLCLVRGDASGYVITSTDGGATFGPHHRTPSTRPDAVGAASPTTIIVTVASVLYRSTDAGASWAAVSHAPAPPANSDGHPVIGFENAQTGRCVLGSAAVLTTTDAGHSWKTYKFA